MRLSCSSLCLLVSLVAAAAIQAADRPPNIVVILTDDMGYSDLRKFGESEIETPHIDRLAAEGTRCTAAYTAAPICVPSRMALLSGRYPARFGIYDNIYGAPLNRIWIEQRTIGEMLEAGGYHTAAVGKWHLSGAGDFDYAPPHDRGFDEYVGIPQGMSGYGPGTAVQRLVAGRYEKATAPEYLTDFFGTEACDVIRRAGDAPLFLYLAFNAPHAPLEASKDDLAAVAGADAGIDRRRYAAMLRAIDRNVGRVMEALRIRGLDRDTLTIFLNDNGGGGGNAPSHTRNTARNLPFRGHKFDVFEGGVRVPFIVHWPGRVAAGDQYTGVASSMDVLPTCLAAAGLAVPHDLDGVDLMPFLRGERSGDPHPVLCWEQRQWSRPNERKPAAGAPKPAYGLAVRSGRWKAVRQDQPFGGGGDDARPWELYDLDRDPAELADLAVELPAKTRELADAFTAWQQKMTPPLRLPPREAATAPVRPAAPAD